MHKDDFKEWIDGVFNVNERLSGVMLSISAK